MNTTESRTLAIATAVAAAILAGASANAQPPAQGPPAASMNSHNMVTSFYTGAVGLVVDTNVAAKNQQLSTLLKIAGASLSWAGESYSPYMLQTQYKDRPNEFYVNIPYYLTYTFSIAGQSLSITQGTNIQAYCEGWQTGSGVLTVKEVMDPPYFDPDQFSWVADALQIPSALQGQIRSALSSIPSGTFPMPAGLTVLPCRSLGATTKAQGLGDNVIWDAPSGFRSPIVTALSEMSVRVLKVTRLTLHNQNGILYEDVETPHLDLWAGYSRIHLDLPPMVEGQSWVPGTNAVIQTPVPSDSQQLVIITDMTYDSGAEEDSSFALFGKSTSFGNGTQNVMSTKTWSEPSPIKGGKPFWAVGNGYQVTLQISTPSLQSVAVAPVSTTPVVPVTAVTGVFTARQ